MPVSGKEPPILKGLPAGTDGFGAWLKTDVATSRVPTIPKSRLSDLFACSCFLPLLFLYYLK